MRKYFAPFLLATAIFCGAILLVWYAKYTVAAGEECVAFAGITYGYRIEQYYARNSMRLTIWEKRGLSYGMEMAYDLPAYTVDEVVEQRWLKNDAAIYLNVQIKYHDSLVTVRPARMIYDFHRGELYTSSNFTLWRLWNEMNTSEGWMSDPEFDSILSRLSKEVGQDVLY